MRTGSRVALALTRPDVVKPCDNAQLRALMKQSNVLSAMDDGNYLPRKLSAAPLRIPLRLPRHIDAHISASVTARLCADVQVGTLVRNAVLAGERSRALCSSPRGQAMCA